MNPEKKLLQRRTNCRLCLNSQLQLAFSLKPSPIGDLYVTQDQLGQAQEVYPLDLYLCTSCFHLQHLDIVDPSLLFRNYTFKTISSPSLVKHFQSYADDVMRLTDCTRDSLVVEIGSNDGSLLKFFQERGMRVLGIDPALAIASQATHNGIETLPDFFTSALANEITEKYGQAAIVCANNVYAHIDDLNDVTTGIKSMLAPEGVFVFEASYLLDILQKNLFDTIYHEHLSYHSVTPLVEFFRKHGLELFHLERIPTKSGSLRGYVKQANSNRAVATSVKELMDLETSFQLNNLETFKNFAQRLETIKLELHSLLQDLKKQSKSIAGFGASVTVTTLLYHFELGPFLDFLIDDNPEKNGLYSPGLHLPVLNSKVLHEENNVDYVVILAWQHQEPIRKRHQEYIANGGHFIVPLPEVKVLP